MSDPITGDPSPVTSTVPVEIVTTSDLGKKLDRLLKKDWWLEVIKLVVPVFTALVAASAAILGSYLTFDRKNVEIAATKFRDAAQLARDSDQIKPEHARVLAEILRKQVGEQEFVPVLAMLEAIAIGDSDALGAATVIAAKASPELAKEYVDVAVKLSPVSTPEVESSIATSTLPEETKKEIMDAARFQELLRKIEDAPTKNERVSALVEMKDNWQHTDAFVEILIEACNGKVQYWSEQGVNVRLINTLEILRLIDIDVLRSNSHLVSSWIEKDIIRTGVGLKTQDKARNVLMRLDGE